MFAVERRAPRFDASDEPKYLTDTLTKTGILITRSTISEISRAASVVVQVRLIWLICDFLFCWLSKLSKLKNNKDHKIKFGNQN